MMRSSVWSPDSLAELELHNVLAERVDYQGRRALRLIEESMGQGGIAVIPDSDFGDGMIETEVVGVLRPDAPPEMRGFVGIAFRVRDGGAQ